MKRLFNRLGIFIENKRLLIIIFSLALIVPSIFGAMQLEMKTGYETFVSTDSQVYQDYERFSKDFSSDVVIILLTGDNIDQLLDPDNIELMGSLEDEFNAYHGVSSAIGPAFLIRQAALQGGIPDLPENGLPDNLLILQGLVLNGGQISSNFSSVFPDNEHAIIAVTLDADLSSDEQKEVIKDIESAIANTDAEFDGIETIITGTPVVFNVMTDSLGSSMRNMLLLSVGIMFLVLALIFSVRGFFAWRWLPLCIVLIAIVYAFGLMGILSIPITMATMSVFPILIGLGVDYGIQFHNRYDEEVRKGGTVAEAIIDSVTHMGPTIGISLIAACLGFAALFFSPVPMIRDFGLTLIIGVVACYLLSIFFLLAILYWHDRRNGTKADKKKNTKPKKEGMHVVDRGLRRLAPWVIRSPAIILSIALLLCAGGLVADSYIGTETDTMKYLDQDLPAIQDLHSAENVLGGVRSINIFIEAEDIADPEILAWMVQLEERIGEEQSAFVTGSNSIADLVMQATLQSTGVAAIPQDPLTIKGMLQAMPEQSKSNFVTEDYTAANMVITLPELTNDQREELIAQLTDYVADPPVDLEATVTGSSVFFLELLGALSSGRLEMTLMGIAMVFVGLFILFKFKIVKALVAILPIGLILGWSSGVMYLLGIDYTPLTATLGALIIGIGVEYTILLIMRYYEERRNGEEVDKAMIIAMTRIGRAVIASGLTTIGGFGALLIAWDFPIIQDFGIVTLINVFFALVSTLLVLPALIVLIDRWRERRKTRKDVEQSCLVIGDSPGG